MSFETTKQKARSFFKRLLLVLILAGIVFSGVYYFYRTYTVSEGTRTGILFKISKKLFLAEKAKKHFSCGKKHFPAEKAKKLFSCG